MKLSNPLPLFAAVVVGIGVLLGYRQVLPPSDSGGVAVDKTTTTWQAGYRRDSCWFDVPVDRNIDCGYLFTPAKSGKFQLPVVIIRDDSSDHRDDPLVYLSGGPGNSSFLEPDNIDSWYYWVDTADLSRDLILMDQRGTGMSEPRWDCENYSRFVRDVLRVNLTLEQEYQRAYNTIHDCLKQVQRQGFEQRHYSTTRSAEDLALLMQQLGYQQWNVMGVSYGTRLALDWLRRSDNHIRSLILDSVYPLDKGLLNERPELLHRALQNIWHSCARGDICIDPELLGNPELIEQRFWAALEQLSSDPLKLSAANWEGDWPVSVVLNDNRFMSVVYSAQYDSFLHSAIIDAINEVLGKKPGHEALEQIVEHSVNSELSADFNTLVYLAIECRETAAISEEAYDQASAKYPKLQRYTRYDWRFNICRDFTVRSDLAEFNQVFDITVPSLILAGELDPVTPSSWARELQQYAAHSQLLILPGVGHGAVASSECVHTQLRNFLDGPEQQLPERCEAIN